MNRSNPSSARWIKAGPALSVLLLFALGWIIWVKYLDATWIEYHYPADGAVNIPLHDTVIVQWKMDEVSNTGLRMEYADDPSTPIQGVTSGSKDGMSFMPEGLLPEKKVKVTVAAGWRSYSFAFTTAHESDQGIDLYRSILKSFFKAPSKDRVYDFIALDTSSFQDLKEEDKKQLAEGILVYHPSVLYGSPEKGFQPVDEMVAAPYELKNKEILLLSLKKVKEELGTYEFELEGKRGMGVLAGKGQEEFEAKYSAVYRSGKWEVRVESIGK